MTTAFYDNLRRYLAAAGLPPCGVHVLRHAAAKLRGDAGQEVSHFLDHSNLAVTSAVSAELREDLGWAMLAEAIGI